MQNKALKIDKNFTRADELLSRLKDYNNSESKSHLDEMLDKLEKKPHIRCCNMFEIHCIDSNEFWINQIKKKL